MRQGTGAPVDAIDQACKDWHSCVECLNVDHGCDVFPIIYEPAGQGADGRVSCENDVNDDCSLNACKVFHNEYK